MLKRLQEWTRHAHIWAPGYLASKKERSRELQRLGPPKRAWIVIADHFEPLWKQASEDVAQQRVDRWRQAWPEIARDFEDLSGKKPRYTFFYPEEQYAPHLLEPLAEMTAMGIGDVEIHLHHDNDTEANFIDRMSRFTEALSTRHGLLRRYKGKLAFGFIHGNWALDNSRPDGRWCGLNNEITLLSQLGCYADFTNPSAPNPTQTRIVNTIYWATDDPARPKSHDRGIPFRPGQSELGDLLVIPGPLAVLWKTGRIIPKLECGELASYYPPSQNRVDAWLHHAPRVGEDIFIKVFTHGCQERHSQHLLVEGGLKAYLKLIHEACARENCEPHFVSAWEMWEALNALRQGKDPLSAVFSHPAAFVPGSL